jgi:uncharacterized protein (DUF1684 family)
MRILLALSGAVLAQTAAVGGDAYTREIESWRDQRLAQLTAPDGWLTLIGLHDVREGANTVGSAPGNDIVLAAGPGRVGTLTMSPDGALRLAVEAAAGVQVDGVTVGDARLRPESAAAQPTLVTCGTVSFHAIERGGKKALRVRDRDSTRRRQFAGIDTFPIDRGWRIEARWEAFSRSRHVRMTTAEGRTSPAFAPGQAVFSRGGKAFRLLPIDEGPQRPLLFVISDATSGKDTYAGGRFLYAERPAAGEMTIVLDFNRAENPPCAFTPFAICPLPPNENQLPFAVTAGEREYRE